MHGFIPISVSAMGSVGLCERRKPHFPIGTRLRKDRRKKRGLMAEGGYGLKITRLENYEPRTNRIVTEQEIENKRKLWSDIFGKEYTNAYIELLYGESFRVRLLK